jgi:hypothetical protein
MPETEGGTTIIQFDHRQLFTNRRELIVEGVPVPLGNRAFDVRPGERWRQPMSGICQLLARDSGARLW